MGWPPPDTGNLLSANGDYAVGDHLRVADIDVTVLAMWHEPDAANDAVDVRIVRLDHHA